MLANLENGNLHLSDPFTLVNVDKLHALPDGGVFRNA